MKTMNKKIPQITVFTALIGLEKMLKIQARRYGEVRELMKQKNCCIQIRLKDNSQGRYFIFDNGSVRSKNGIHPRPDATLIFYDAETAAQLMMPMHTQLDQLNAMKNFKVVTEGPDELSMWFTRLCNLLISVGQYHEYGTDMGNGVKRYANCTTAGPVFVYVKDGKILRITPIEFDDTDADSWTIKARGKEFTPPRISTLSAYGFNFKSQVYSPDRLLYPLKRVDFDPGGERNCKNRGVSGYERISWDEALDIVAGEIKRVKRDHGPGAIMASTGSHHTFGNNGYYMSAQRRFMNMIGHTFVLQNADSWEGWYWGAMHHWGSTFLLGAGDPSGSVEEALKHCEMMIFWSSDPESTNGAYGGMEGTIRRLWLRDLGVKFVHIDPYYNHTAALLGGKWIAPRPDYGNAMALAIAHVWITEDLYDKEYIQTRTTGFDEWKDYVLGKKDGIPKTPEWQEKETNVPAKDVRALAREWASKKTFLGVGGFGCTLGGACRSATGIEWARSMVCLMAMRGLGKEGVSLGNMQAATPLDCTFFFPGYCDGGFSGDLAGTASAIQMYQRMPHLPTVNPYSRQMVPRINIPEAILEGKTKGYGNMADSKYIEHQFQTYEYPQPGFSRVRMYYRYGGSFIGTMPESNRFVKAYRTDEVEFVVNQSIWMEGEAKFADIILPACTNFERWDISEAANPAGYAFGAFTQLNHRVITLQHKCIEPLGESKSDYEIFYELAKRLNLGAYYSEGCTELDWVKKTFDASDLPKYISWKEFMKKGYFVVPAPEAEEHKQKPAYRWFAEGRNNDTYKLGPLPADMKDGMADEGLQTPSGKIEFVATTLRRYDPDDPERPPMSTYIPSWEGHHTLGLLRKYPLQMITPHARYTFNTMNDGKSSCVNDVKDHRVLIDGYYYWIIRMNTRDAMDRGIKNDDLVKVYNDRGAVICAARVTERLPRGTVHSYSSSAVYDPIGEPGTSPDRGGCINILTPKRPIISRSSSTAAGNSNLVQIERWGGE